MCVETVQREGQKMWGMVEPYAVPGAVAAGVTFIVNQIWGEVAAVCFLAGAMGFAFAFPSVISQITQDDVVMVVVRSILTIALPFFGPIGIAGCVGISVLSNIAQDLRLYSIREKLSRADAIGVELEKKAHERALEREKLIAKANEKALEAEKMFKEMPNAGLNVSELVSAFEEKIQGIITRLGQSLADFPQDEFEKIAEDLQLTTHAFKGEKK
jgi:hypothetical protein